MMKPDNDLPSITFAIHDVEGGVASMNAGIIANGGFGDHFRTHVILWRSIEEKSKNFRETFAGVDEVSYFHYSDFDNYYLTLKKFNGLINKWPGRIVTNDGMELESIREFGTSSVVFSIVHDFYNLKLAIENLDLIDYFICHTETFAKALLSSYPLRERVKFMLHGVKVGQGRGNTGEMIAGDRGAGGSLKIVSISRLTAAKGVLLFFEINECLLKKGIKVEWLVIGSGELEKDLKRQWAGQDNITFYSPDQQEEVSRIAGTGNIFISPSNFEGYGIALLEAMACGLVPIIHRLPVGIYGDLPETIGFSVKQGDVNGFADAISRLDRDQDLLVQMGRRARQLIIDKYDITSTARDFMEFFEAHPVARTDRGAERRRMVNFGILDRRYIPNKLAFLIKKIARRDRHG